MRASDEYRTIAAPVRAELVVQSSRFIADVFPIDSTASADGNLQKIKKEFYNATHHCWAYRIGEENPATRANDDGEPSGTAGKPILTALERKDVTNALIIVTRYFGGVKLGTGGLARAYGEAAKLALDKAEIVTKVIFAQFTLSCDYDVLPKVKSLLYKHGKIIREEFEPTPKIIFEVRKSDAENLKILLNDAARGKVEIKSL
ncbi:MAG TPA: YigZ family protein [Candidatus Kapabacteria bacterium]|nr:YigZ family protein [Candidatus Kapabacteria bacterium]